MKNIIIAFLTIIIFTNCGDSREDRKKLKEQRHCESSYVESKNKSRLLKDVINDPSINSRMSFSYTAGQLLKNSVKYPSTIIIDGRKFDGGVYLRKKYATAIDTTSGTWSYVINFTTKNKLNMDVRSKLQLDMRYDVGCKKNGMITKVKEAPLLHKLNLRLWKKLAEKFYYESIKLKSQIRDLTNKF